MTTGRRSTYNRIKDLQGMIYGMELAQQSYNHDIQNHLDRFITELNDLVDNWYHKYSSNKNVNSNLNNQSDKKTYDEIFYSYDRIKQYNDIRKLSGIISGLQLADVILRETNDSKALNDYAVKLEHTLRSEMRIWKQNYAGNKTVNSYELPM